MDGSIRGTSGAPELCDLEPLNTLELLETLEQWDGVLRADPEVASLLRQVCREPYEGPAIATEDLGQTPFPTTANLSPKAPRP